MYKINYGIKVENDLIKLDQSIRKQVFNKIEKISANPQVWQNLSWDLAWYKKVYIARKKLE